MIVFKILIIKIALDIVQIINVNFIILKLIILILFYFIFFIKLRYLYLISNSITLIYNPFFNLTLNHVY